MNELELSPMERMAADLETRRAATMEEPAKTQETTTVAQTEEQTTTNQTEETQTTEPQKPLTISELVTHQPSPEELQTKELEQKILAKYEDKFKYLSKIEQNEAMKFLIDNWDNIEDKSKAFANNTVDHSKKDHFELHLEVAKMNGIEINETDMEEEKSIFDSKLANMTPIEKELYKKELISKLPTGQDNSIYLEKEKERLKKIAEQQQIEANKSQEYWIGKEQIALDLKSKLVGFEMPEVKVKITQEMVDNVYAKLNKGWASERYFVDGDYKPELEITDLLFAEIGRNAHNIFSSGKVEGEIKAVQERQNVTKNQSPQNNDNIGSTEAQKQRVKAIEAVYGNNPALLEQKLKDENLFNIKI